MKKISFILFVIVFFLIIYINLHASIDDEVKNVADHANQSSAQLHDSLFQLYQSIKKEESKLGAGKRFGTIFEREKRFSKLKPINESLEPIKPLIASYALEGSDETKPLAISLLEYVKTDESVVNVLYELVEGKEFSGKALDVIFSLGEDTSDLRQKVVGKIRNEEFEGNEYQAIPYWKIEEALPLYIDFLSSTSRLVSVTNLNAKLREDFSQSSKRNFKIEFAAKALKELGEDAGKALPALKRTLEQAKRTDADFRTIETLTFAIQSIERDIFDKEGVLGLSWATNQISENIPTNTNLTQPATNAQAPKTEIGNSNWLKWVLIVSALGIVGFLVFSFLGKKNSN